MPPRSHRDLHARLGDALSPIWDTRTGLTVRIKAPSGTAVAPNRTRCRACRNALGDVVVLGMYCGYRCAGLPAPAATAAAAPRECRRVARTDEPGQWVFKQRFTDEATAQQFLKPGMNVYRCSHCFALHLGNTVAPAQPAAAAGSGGGDLLGDCVSAVLRARGQSPESASAVARAKRDVRAVLEVVDAHRRSSGPRR